MLLNPIQYTNVDFLFSKKDHDERTKPKKCLENNLRKAFNWLKHMDLIPNNLKKASPREIHILVNRKGQLCFYNKELFSLFF